MLLLSTDFENLCESATVYLDTNVFIYAFEQPELVELIARLTASNTAFATISSVEYEFTRGSQSLQEIRDKREFLRGLVHRVLPVGNLLESDKNDVFSAAMSLVVGKNNSSYTDFLLATVLHSYNRIPERQYILSADVPAFPQNIFTVEGIMSIRLSKGNIVHLNLISLDKDKYRMIIEKVAKEKS
jgi:predicted nucleic acid-binding protein